MSDMDEPKSLPVKLKYISFNGFKADNRIAEVTFSSDSASVIYGENGCGKTTFLKLIHALLTKDTLTLAKESVISACVRYSFDNEDYETNVFRVTAIELDFGGGTIDLEKNEKRTIGHQYNWEEFDNSPLSTSRSLSLGVERGVTNQSVKIDVIDVIRALQSGHFREFNSRLRMQEFAENLVFSLRKYQTMRNRHQRDDFDLEGNHCYLQNIKLSNIENLLLDRYKVARGIATEKIQNALFDTLALAIEQSEKKDHERKYLTIPQDFGATIIKSKERIIEALKDGTVNNFKSSVISFLEGFKKSDELYKIKDNQILLQLIINMVNQLQIEKQLLSSINIFIDTFNQFLVGGKELKVTKDEIYVDIDGDHCTIDSLSSGERHIFTFLALIVVTGRGRDFLIIDEPEISLNIRWQRTLLDLLRRLLPDTQIIVASHSPVISKRSPQSLVELTPYKAKA